MAENRKLAAILAADVVGFSRLAGSDEDRTLARLRALRSDLIDPTIAVHSGRVVKRTGDGAIVEFRSVVDAVRCALEIQQAMVDRNAGVADDRRIEFRIGIHLGDVVEEADGDLMGDGVNIAARLEGLAEPGTICLSDDAYRQVKARLDILVRDLGEKQLKNIADPMRIYALQIGSSASLGERSVLKGGMAVVAPGFDRLAIAVLPFTNMSGDLEQEYFADGISEDIITALSKLSQLFVIARNSSFTFKGRNVHVQDAAKVLGARYVLEGSVRKSSNRVRVTAQLIDAASGGHLWADRFDRDLTDIFEVQDDVTQHIVAALAVKLTDSDRQRMTLDHTDNVDAYDCCLRGREAFWRSGQVAIAEAKVLFSKAIELDPAYASAHAWLAASLVVDSAAGWSDEPAKTLETADQIVMKALALDERDAHCHWARCLVDLYLRRHDQAIDAGRRATALNPNFALAHGTLGEALYYAGSHEQALASVNTAIALNPYNPDLLLHFQALANVQLRRFDVAVGLLKKRLGANPNTDASRVLLASCFGHLGMIGEARDMWEEALSISPGYSLEKRRTELPYKEKGDFEIIVDGIRKAGLAV